MKLDRRTALLSLGGLAWSALGQKKEAGTETEEPATIKVDVDVVSLLCSVRNKQGGLVGNLTKDDFQVFEEGKQQEIRYFARETDLPLTIGLLIDVSISQQNLIETERRAASAFFHQVLRKKDLAFLISFGAEAELLQDLTGSPALLEKGLRELRLSGPAGGLHPGPVPTMSQPRGTILYDAIYLAATDRLQGESGRKAIVLITDGMDFGSRIKLEKALETAQKSDAIIYSIYYVDPSAYGYGFGAPGDGALDKLSKETGGRLFRVSRKYPLERIFTELQEEMRSQYAIGYTPPEARNPGDFRKLEIKTRDKDMKVQARKGYYVPGADSGD
jgi:VWFA-related protein